MTLRMRLLLAALLGLAAVASSPAKEVAGVTVPETVTLGGEALVLNGAGVRSRFFIKVYVGALYLPEPASEPAAVLRGTGPKRVLLHFLYRELAADRLRGAWQDGFEANLTATERESLAAAIDAFQALFPDVREGDELAIDYLPGEGTRVSHNGEILGTVPGEAFHRAWLRIFIGDDPADGSLKRGLLGQ